MKVSLRMIRKDLLTNEEEVLLETEALLNGNRLLYRESENARQSVMFGHEIILERHADVTSCTVLKPLGRGISTVDSIYGTMEMETELVDAKRTEEEWMAEYRLLSGKETVLHQRIIWQIAPKK